MKIIINLSMSWTRIEINIKAKKRGFSLITKEIKEKIPEIKKYKIGILHLFIKHTSASITINENYDPSVRNDLETHFNHMVSEKEEYYTHTEEGPDDMTSHIKSTIIGNNISIHILNGKLNLGIWQGIYLCEHRNITPLRKISAIIHGETY